MIRNAFIFLLLLALACACYASDAEEGTTDGEYAFSSGYWWKGDSAYTREKWEEGGYYSRCCWVPKTYFYKYYFHHSRITAVTPDWRLKVLEIVKQQKENEEFTKIVQGFGLESHPSIAMQTSYGLSGNLTSNTQYGYSLNSLSSAYAADDSALWQQAYRLVTNAQALAGDGFRLYNDAASAKDERHARIAEILTKGEVLKQVLATPLNGPVSRQQSLNFAVQPSGVTSAIVQSQTQTAQATTDDDAIYQRWTASARDCAQCHSGGKAEGGLDLTGYPGFSTDQKMKIIARLMTDDPGKIMPRDTSDKTKPGRKRTAEELQAWLSVKPQRSINPVP